jgi:hypothetical protein
MTRKQNKPVKDLAPNGMREQVALAASRAWQEPTSVIWLGRAYRCRIRFEVSGLRSDGTVLGEHRVRWFFARLPWGLAMTLGYTVTVLCSVFWVLIQYFLTEMIFGPMTGGGKATALNWRRKATIRGGAPFVGSAAAGRLLTRKRGHLWLVFAPHGVAFTHVVQGRQEVLWSDNSRGGPRFAMNRAVVYWQDNSVIEVPWPGRKPQPAGTYSAAEQPTWPT